MKFLLPFILISASVEAQVVNTISMNNPVNSFNAATVTASVGTKFTLPTQATQCTWQTIYGTAPASITVQLQTSIDGTNFPPTDTSTSTAGEIRTIYTSARQIRAEITASSGGTTITVTINCKNAPIAVVSASGTTTVNSNKFLAGDGTAAAPSYTFVNETGLGFYRNGSNRLGVGTGGVAAFEFNSGVAFDLLSNGALVRMGSTNDVVLARDAANTLALRNGTNAQLFRVYNSYTDASNYEAFAIRWLGNQVRLEYDTSGSGAAGRAVGIWSAGTNYWTWNTNGHYITGTDNTYDIGASGATRPRTGYFGTSIAVGTNNVLRAGTPVVTGNGTLVAGGTNTAGKVTSTTTGAATITITFSSAWTNAPACVVTNETTANLARATSTTALVNVIGTTVTGDVISYNCIGW